MDKPKVKLADVKRMNRLELLAAEVFSYSYANYADHHGNPRFDTIMPDIAATLERAVKEQWPIEKLAKELKVDREEGDDFLKAYHRSLEVVDAEEPRRSVSRRSAAVHPFRLRGRT